MKEKNGIFASSLKERMIRFHASVETSPAADYPTDGDGDEQQPAL